MNWGWFIVYGCCLLELIEYKYDLSLSIFFGVKYFIFLGYKVCGVFNDLLGV